MLLNKSKKGQGSIKGGNRLLISVTVIGSAGPIRFVVKEKEMVAAVIVTVLKVYARERRLPLLGTDLKDFVLYCPLSGTDALSPRDTIGSFGMRNFMLCKTPRKDTSPIFKDEKQIISRKGINHRRWKAWFNKSLNLKISIR